MNKDDLYGLAAVIYNCDPLKTWQGEESSPVPFALLDESQKAPSLAQAQAAWTWCKNGFLREQNALQAEVETINPDYVELAAKSIYNSVNDPLRGLTLVYVATWAEIGDDLKDMYRIAAQNVIKVLLSVFYREEEALALAAQKASPQNES